QVDELGDSESYEELLHKIEALEQEKQEIKDSILRVRADEENTRKRARLDVENAHKYGIERFAKSLLNILDSLESGVETARSNVIQKGFVLHDRVLRPARVIVAKPN